MILVKVQSGRLPFIHVSSDSFKMYFMCCQLSVYCTLFLLIMCPKTLRVLFTKLIKTPAPGIQLLGSRFVSRKISLKHAALSDFTHHLKATEKSCEIRIDSSCSFLSMSVHTPYTVRM